MDKRNIISLINLAASIILILVLVLPFWSSMKDCQAEIDKHEQTINEIEKLLERTQQLKQEYQKVEEQAEENSLALPQEKDVPLLLIQFEALASSNGLVLESIEFGQIIEDTKEAAQSVFRSLPIEVSVSGSYNAFKSYLVDLENSIRSMNVSSINFNTQAYRDISPADFFKFRLRVDVYYR